MTEDRQTVKSFIERWEKSGAAERGTAAWDTAMERARGQAEQYIRALPAEAQGKIRWLRPDFQCPEKVQGKLDVDATPSSHSPRSASPGKRDGDVASTTKKQSRLKFLPIV